MASQSCEALPRAPDPGGVPGTRLLRLRVTARGSTTVYVLDLVNGRDCWAVQRRYSDFRSCRTALHENFSKSEFPPFPPKESLRSKVWGKSKESRARWAEQRRLQLQAWLEGALQHPRVSRFPPLRSLLEEPSGDDRSFFQSQPASSFQSQAGGADLSEPEVINHVALSSVRVRLAGERGTIQIVARADGSQGLCPQRVRLALFGATGISCDALVSWEVAMTVTEDGASEAVHEIVLCPGAMCEIRATPLGAGGIAGDEVNLQFHVPSASDFAVLFPERGRERVGSIDAEGRRRVGSIDADSEPTSCIGCGLTSPAASDVSTEAPEDEAEKAMRSAGGHLSLKAQQEMRRARCARLSDPLPQPRRASNTDNGLLRRRLTQAGFM